MTNAGIIGGTKGMGNGKATGGSRYAILADETGIEAGGDETEIQAEVNLLTSSLHPVHAEGSVVSVSEEAGNNEARRKSSSGLSDSTKTRIRVGKDLRKTGHSGSGGQDKLPMVAVQGKIVHGNTVLNPEKHTMVEVVDVERVPSARGAKGRYCLCC
ncbi:hypothetical protein V6N13_050896 [Hibiscus sabdariffa]